MFSSPSRLETLLLLVKSMSSAIGHDVAGMLHECLTSCNFHPIVAHDRWDHISPEDHLKLLPAFCYFSHAINCRLALHFWHGVAFGTKYPHKGDRPGEFVWHPNAPGKRSIWRVFPDETQPLPAQEENHIRAALVSLAKYIRIIIDVPKNNANGSTIHKSRISGTGIEFIRHSLEIGGTLTHEISHAWWNAIHGHTEFERCFETYPEQEIGLAQEWFVHRGTFSVNLHGLLKITRLPSSAINEAYHSKTHQLSANCRVTTEDREYCVNDDDACRLVNASFWNGEVLANPLVLRGLVPHTA